MSIPTTVSELRARCALSLCYDDAQLLPLLAVAATDPLQALLAIPRPDARRVLAGLLPCKERITWARACADRAQTYADAANYAADAANYAAAAATSAADAATYAAISAISAAADAADAAAAAYAAAYAANAADAARAARAAAAAADTEHRTAMQHGLSLLLAAT